MMTSHGNQETIQQAKEILTAAVIGLLFIIFSLVALQVIGVDILRIPGFRAEGQSVRGLPVCGNDRNLESVNGQFSCECGPGQTFNGGWNECDTNGKDD